MEIKINNRLLKISDFVYNNEKIIDVGCDHGLLGIYLYLNRSNLKIISSDINIGPLKKAKENLIKYNLTNNIKLKLGNGLKPIENDINTVIISGMGFLTIKDILKDIKYYPQVQKLIISPNNDFRKTRKNIIHLGFYIDKEIIVKENNKYYLVTSYLKGKQKRINYFFGKLDLNDKVVINYYQDIIKKNKFIIKKLNLKHIIKKLFLYFENKYIIFKFRIFLNNK